jgi:hypothetical protein
MTYLICDISTAHLLTDSHNACNANASLRQMRDILLICTSALSAPLCIWLFIVIWSLRRHQRDGYGLLGEVILEFGRFSFVFVFFFFFFVPQLRPAYLPLLNQSK